MPIAWHSIECNIKQTTTAIIHRSKKAESKKEKKLKSYKYHMRVHQDTDHFILYFPLAMAQLDLVLYFAGSVYVSLYILHGFVCPFALF